MRDSSTRECKNQCRDKAVVIIRRSAIQMTTYLYAETASPRQYQAGPGFVLGHPIACTRIHDVSFLSLSSLLEQQYSAWARERETGGGSSSIDITHNIPTDDWNCRLFSFVFPSVAQTASSFVPATACDGVILVRVLNGTLSVQDRGESCGNINRVSKLCFRYSVFK